MPVANHEATRRLQEAAAQARAGWRTLQRGDRLDAWRRRAARPPPARAGLGAPEGPQRRFDRARAPFRPRVDAAYRRHRSRSGEEPDSSPRSPADSWFSSRRITAAGPRARRSSSTRSHPTWSSSAAAAGTRTGIHCRTSCPLPRGRRAGVWTDLEGQIDVVTDGQSLTVETFTGRRSR